MSFCRASVSRFHAFDQLDDASLPEGICGDARRTVVGRNWCGAWRNSRIGIYAATDRCRHSISAASNSIAEVTELVASVQNGWSCDSANWLFFDSSCVGPKRRKHHHPRVIVENKPDKVVPEHERESTSPVEKPTVPVEAAAVQASTGTVAKSTRKVAESATKRKHRRREIESRMARTAVPWQMAQTFNGYYAYGGTPTRSGADPKTSNSREISRFGSGHTCNPRRHPSKCLEGGPKLAF
jgi:hypothetical protein